MVRNNSGKNVKQIDKTIARSDNGKKNAQELATKFKQAHDL